MQIVHYNNICVTCIYEVVVRLGQDIDFSGWSCLWILSYSSQYQDSNLKEASFPIIPQSPCVVTE